MTLTSIALKERLRNLRKNRLLHPLAFFVKKYIYNTYVKSRTAATNFPPEVWIENTNCCNAECVMCPREKQTRPLGIMELSLFEKLIKEISKFKGDVRRVHLHNYGEPLLDKEFPIRIRLAKDWGIEHVYFVTNASLLTPELSREIIVAGLDEFKISFYGTDKKTYNDTMNGLDYDKTIKNVKAFFEIRKDMKSLKPMVVIQYIPQTKNQSRIDAFLNLFNDVIDKNIGDSLNICSLHNYADGRYYVKNGSNKISTICRFPWATMVILQDGNVVICCLDYNGVQVVGDVNENTIKEIWNSEQYKKIRSDFKGLRYSDYPVCTKCNVIH
jgi:radical SAM protein with 4Fe4S-binding SPASM domain